MSDMPEVIWAGCDESYGGFWLTEETAKNYPPKDTQVYKYIRADAIGKHLASLTREQIASYGLRVQHTPDVSRDEVLHEDLPDEWDVQS